MTSDARFELSCAAKGTVNCTSRNHETNTKPIPAPEGLIRGMANLLLALRVQQVKAM
jgi:hypothetical protein